MTAAAALKEPWLAQSAQERLRRSPTPPSKPIGLELRGEAEQMQQENWQLKVKLEEQMRLHELERENSKMKLQLQSLEALQEPPQRTPKNRFARAVAVFGCTKPPLPHQPQMRMQTPCQMPQESQRQAQGGFPLGVGLKCRYFSSEFGWLVGVVQGLNNEDGTFNLDCQQHAPPDRIAPIVDTSATEPWPAGTWVWYESSTWNKCLPCVVVAYNCSDGTYDLNMREHAPVDRIRARLGDKPTQRCGEVSVLPGAGEAQEINCSPAIASALPLLPAVRKLDRNQTQNLAHLLEDSESQHPPVPPSPAREPESGSDDKVLPTLMLALAADRGGNGLIQHQGHEAKALHVPADMAQTPREMIHL